MKTTTLTAILTIGAVGAATAKVDLVTLPTRDTVQLTIYNSADLTLVRESRALTRHAGGLFRPSEAKLRELVEQLIFSNLEFIVERARAAGVEPVFASFASPDPDLLDGDERRFFEYNAEMQWTGRYLNFETYLWALGLYNQWLEEWCAERELAFIPMADAVRGGGELFLDICHVRNKGIELKAEAVAEFAEERWGEEILRRAALRAE